MDYVDISKNKGTNGFDSLEFGFASVEEIPEELLKIVGVGKELLLEKMETLLR